MNATSNAHAALAAVESTPTAYAKALAAAQLRSALDGLESIAGCEDLRAEIGKTLDAIHANLFPGAAPSIEYDSETLDAIAGDFPSWMVI